MQIQAHDGFWNKESIILVKAWCLRHKPDSGADQGKFPFFCPGTIHSVLHNFRNSRDKLL